jgi:hypothetical protein
MLCFTHKWFRFFSRVGNKSQRERPIRPLSDADLRRGELLSINLTVRIDNSGLSGPLSSRTHVECDVKHLPMRSAVPLAFISLFCGLDIWKSILIQMSLTLTPLELSSRCLCGILRCSASGRSPFCSAFV